LNLYKKIKEKGNQKVFFSWWAFLSIIIIFLFFSIVVIGLEKEQTASEFRVNYFCDVKQGVFLESAGGLTCLFEDKVCKFKRAGQNGNVWGVSCAWLEFKEDYVDYEKIDYWHVSYFNLDSVLHWWDYDYSVEDLKSFLQEKWEKYLKKKELRGKW